MASPTNAIPRSPLSTAQLDAVAFLALGNSITVTAHHTGIHRATIYNWLKLPEFCAVLEQGRRDHMALVHSKLREISELALDTIRHSLTDPAVPPSVKLKAALAVLDRPVFPQPLQSLPPQIDEELRPDLVLPPPAPKPAPVEPHENSEVARNAPCPCGSGNKYKRCCGTNAPPVLGRAA